MCVVIVQPGRLVCNAGASPGSRRSGMDVVAPRRLSAKESTTTRPRSPMKVFAELGSQRHRRVSTSGHANMALVLVVQEKSQTTASSTHMVTHLAKPMSSAATSTLTNLK